MFITVPIESFRGAIEQARGMAGMLAPMLGFEPSDLEAAIDGLAAATCALELRVDGEVVARIELSDDSSGG